MNKPPSKWRVYYKLVEEMGELAQVLGKLSYESDPQTLKNLEDEVADVLAAIQMFIELNKLDEDLIGNRISFKTKKWGKKDLPSLKVKD